MAVLAVSRESIFAILPRVSKAIILSGETLLAATIWAGVAIFLCRLVVPEAMLFHILGQVAGITATGVLACMPFSWMTR